MVNLLRPRKSLGSLSNRDKAFPLPTGSSTPGRQGGEEGRWSGENLAPSDGYSGLASPLAPPCSLVWLTRGQFASGLGFKVEREGPRMPRRRNEPPPTAFAQTPTLLATTPHRRRRSSIITSNSNSASPSKYKASSTDQSVDAALDSVMRSLRKISMTTTTPSPYKRQQQSRWSLSSSETETESGHPRPSVDSVRSKISGAISVRSRKSEERLRPSMDELLMDVDGDVPPVPSVPTMPPVPSTPRRLRGLRKLLTPRKRGNVTPAPSYPLPHAPTTPCALPQPPAERTLPKKGSFASLRSLAKKSSSTTLRGLFRDEAEPIPCLPHPPTSPSRHGSRPAKSSIGPPHARPTTSPSKFLHEMPRRAPTTPKKDGSDFDMDATATPEMSFSAGTPSTGKGATPLVFTPSFVLSDIHPNTAQSTPSMTPLTAKAQKSRSSRPLVAHLLPRGARYHNGIGMETPPAPLRGLPPPPPSSDHLERRYNPAYSIINSYSRPSIGPSNTSQAKRGPPNPPADCATDASSADDNFVKTHAYAGTFGQRSISTIDVDFTASPDERVRSQSGVKVVSGNDRPVSYASSDGVSQEWELEAYLKEVEARERRGNFF